MGYVYLAFAILSEVIGTLALQASHGFTRPVPSGIVVIAYGLAFYLLSLTLKAGTFPISIAYAIWAGLGIVLIGIAGAVVYKQVPDVPSMIGMGLIVAGVVVINVFSRTSAH